MFISKLSREVKTQEWKIVVIFYSENVNLLSVHYIVINLL